MRNKSGSALIFVSLLVAFVGIIVMLFARSSSLYYAFSVDRMQHARAQYALEALAQYGIACALASSKQSEAEWNTQLQGWPVPNGPYQGIVTVDVKNKTYSITAELFKGTVSCGKIQCAVDVSDKNAIIQEWKQF
ncbi:MAG TPA: hypothetical protein VI521_01585 [Candidatus Babeliales bacterium]|nr:hypothetical protein [Candidatus Babeliales bacterium]